MEQQKITATAALRYAFSTFFTHIVLYLYIAIFAIITMAISLLAKQYLTAVQLMTVNSFILIKFWFWGTYVVIATHIIQTGTAHFSDFIRSFQYALPFFIIQYLFLLPTTVANEFVFSNDLSLLLIGLGLSFFAVIIRYYGQLAVPLFISKHAIFPAIFSSFSTTWRLGGKLATVILFYTSAILMIGIITTPHQLDSMLHVIAEVLLMGVSYVHFADRILEHSVAGTAIALCIIYPLMALSYVYLVKQAELSKKEES